MHDTEIFVGSKNIKITASFCRQNEFIVYCIIGSEIEINSHSIFSSESIYLYVLTRGKPVKTGRNRHSVCILKFI
jgi:hypothetical protein